MIWYGFASVSDVVQKDGTVIPINAYMIDTSRTYPVYVEHDTREQIGWAKLKRTVNGIHARINSNANIEHMSLSIGWHRYGELSWNLDKHTGEWRGTFTNIVIDEVSVVGSPNNPKALIYAHE